MSKRRVVITSILVTFLALSITPVLGAVTEQHTGNYTAWYYGYPFTEKVTHTATETLKYDRYYVGSGYYVYDLISYEIQVENVWLKGIPYWYSQAYGSAIIINILVYIEGHLEFSYNGVIFTGITIWDGNWEDSETISLSSCPSFLGRSNLYIDTDITFQWIVYNIYLQEWYIHWGWNDLPGF